MPTPNTSSPVTGVAVSGTNTTINTMLTPYKWGGAQGTGATISYSFPTNPALFSTDPNVGYGNQQWEVSQFSAMTEEQKTATRAALDAWASVANITFSEVVTESASSVGDLRFANSGYVGDEGAAAWAYYPWPSSPNSGDVWIDPGVPQNSDLELGEYGFSTLLHEIGHAIGLAHPFYDPFLSKPTLPPSQDNQRYTIMAYNLYGGAEIEAYGPMLYDVLVIQYIYGANMETNKFDDVYKFGTDKEYFECIWDAGGHDTFDLSEQTRNQVIDLRAGTFSSIGVKNNGQTGNGNVSIAFGAQIEDAIGGSGHDRITGNNAANDMDGGVGNDTIAGGAGNDVYVVNAAGDSVDEEGNADSDDLVKASVTISLAAGGFLAVEHVLLTGTTAIKATGNGSDNELTGNDAANVLDGLAGADTLTGGKGGDTYVVDSLTDVVSETILNSNGGGVDLVISSVNFSLATRTNVENLTLTGGAINGTGNALNNEIAGNSLGNVLNGGTGNDVLEGGDGGDKMTGGAGRDTFDFNLSIELGDADSITDFTKGAGGDLLDISDLLDDVSYAGSNVFADGYLSFTYNGATTNVMFDGNGGADSALLLVSLTNVTLTPSNTENFVFNYTV